MITKRSRKKGSAITETGPALFILLVMTFFPMLNMVQIGAAYAISNTYHDYMLRELACRNPANANQAMQKINQDFTNNPMFNFIKVQQFNVVGQPQFLTAAGAVVASIPAANLTDDASNNIRRTIDRVRITTLVRVQPYFTIPVPFLAGIPGISAPVNFQETTARPQEEKGIN